MKIQTAEEADRVIELEEQVQELVQVLGKVTLEKLKLEKHPNGCELSGQASPKAGSRHAEAGSAPTSC